MLSLLRSCPHANQHTFLYLMHHLQRFVALLLSLTSLVNKCHGGYWFHSSTALAWSFLTLFFSQSCRNARLQQNDFDELGYSFWSKSVTPPSGWTERGLSGHFPRGGRPGQPKHTKHSLFFTAKYSS